MIVGSDEELYLKWKGFIEAKTRTFCEKVELLMNNFDFDMQIHPRAFKLDEVKLKFPYEESILRYPFGEKMYIGLKVNQEYEHEIDLSHHLSFFLQHIQYEWSTENSMRNEDQIDLFAFLIDREDFRPEVLGIDIGTANEIDDLGIKQEQVY